MQPQPPTSFLDAIASTFSLLLNTPLVEPEIPEKPAVIPLKTLSSSHTFSHGMVLEDLESASDQPVSDGYSFTSIRGVIDLVID